MCAMVDGWEVGSRRDGVKGTTEQLNRGRSVGSYG